MKNLLVLSVVIICGCRGGSSGLVVTGSAYVESGTPEAKAGAKVEVQYPPSGPSFANPTLPQSPDATLGVPEAVTKQAQPPSQRPRSTKRDFHVGAT